VRKQVVINMLQHQTIFTLLPVPAISEIVFFYSDRVSLCTIRLLMRTFSVARSNIYNGAGLFGFRYKHHNIEVKRIALRPPHLMPVNLNFSKNYRVTKRYSALSTGLLSRVTENASSDIMAQNNLQGVASYQVRDKD